MNEPTWPLRHPMAVPTRAAAYTFVLPMFFFSARVGFYSTSLQQTAFELTGMLVIILLTLCRPHQAQTRHGFVRAGIAIMGLALLVVGYLAFQPEPPLGNWTDYALKAILYLVLYSFTIVYASTLYDERHFLNTFWIVGRIALVIALFAFVITLSSNIPILTSNSVPLTPDGFPIASAASGVRLQGFLSEPSAWAPVLTALLLMSIRHRAWKWMVLVLIGAALARSPTVIVVLTFSIALYFGLTTTWRSRVPILALLLLGTPFAASVVLTADANTLLASDNEAYVVVGRLISGIDSIRTDGITGNNDRFFNATVVINELRRTGSMSKGHGLGSADVYFSTKYGSYGIQPNSLPVWTWFSFGTFGAIAVVVLSIVAVFRLRHRPDSAAVLIPFVVASMVNSAQGHQSYKFAILAILAYGCGWVYRPRHMTNRHVTSASTIVS